MTDRTFKRLMAANIGLLLFLAVSWPAAAQDMSGLFRQGMKAMTDAGRAGPKLREALLDRAIAAFRKMLVANPGLVRVRLELGRAFFLKGEDSLARRNFEIALAGKPPPP